MVDTRAGELVRQREEQRERHEIEDAYNDREEAAKEKYADFEQVAYNPRLPITDAMAETIRSCENGPDIVYHLGLNVKEAQRIAKLSPFSQAKEIGKIEAKLAADPPAVRTTSKAPEPIVPAHSQRTTSAPVYDTTDPRSTKSMSTSEWIAAERERQLKKSELQRNR